jgi:hypothetical protein
MGIESLLNELLALVASVLGNIPGLSGILGGL